jgi:signal transduction histidine kinase
MRYKYILHITILLLATNIYSQNIDSLFVESTKFIDKQEELKKLDKLTGILRQQKMSVSMPYYKKLLAEGKRNKDTLLLTKAYLEIAKKYRDDNYIYKSEQYLDSVFNNIHKNTRELSFVLSNALTTKGILEQMQDCQKEAIYYFKESLLIAKENNFKKYIFYNQNNIAVILLRENNVKEALSYFKENINEIDSTQDQYAFQITLLNIGNCYNELSQIDSSEYYFKKVIKNAGNNEYFIHALYQDYAALKVVEKEYDKAEEYIDKSLQIDSMQYEAYIYKGFIYTQTNEYNKAQKNYFKAKNIIETKKLYHELPRVLDSIGKLSQIQGQYKIANEYIIKSMKLTDSLVKQKKESKLINLKKKYNIQEKEQKIQKQKTMIENEKKKIQKTNLLTIVATIFLLSVLLFFFISYIQYKQRHELELVNEIHSERTRIARDLHDNLGAHLSFIISSIDNILFSPSKDKQKLISQIKDIKEFASETTSMFRDTTWALNKDSFTAEDFISRLEIFIKRVQKSKPGTKIFVINKIDSKLPINPVKSLNAFRILQEAINNSVKYSKIDRIAVFFEEKDDFFIIKVIDHGVGFDQENISMGYGLKNMKRRASELGGTITINSENGTEITITIPKNQNKPIK